MIEGCEPTNYRSNCAQLEHPMSALNQTLESSFVRHALSGIAMGATAVAIFTSPLGQRSGAHLNPAVTLHYYMRGKTSRWDAVSYVAAQSVGGLGPCLVAEWLADRFHVEPRQSP